MDGAEEGVALDVDEVDVGFGFGDLELVFFLEAGDVLAVGEEVDACLGLADVNEDGALGGDDDFAGTELVGTDGVDDHAFCAGVDEGTAGG